MEQFKTIPVFDKRAGSYACEIQLLTSLDDLVNSVKNFEYDFELEVIIRIHHLLFLLYFQLIYFFVGSIKEWH